jgi:hypothetical protein
MQERMIFHSSFDSTRYTGRDLPTPKHPNLAFAQAEAVNSILMGRTLVLNNTYAFDSGSVLNLLGTLLDTRDEVLSTKPDSSAGKIRIKAANPFAIRWFGGDDFLSCCSAQLLRLEPAERRFILSHWTVIDHEDTARRELADALTSRSPRTPASIQDNAQLSRSFATVRAIDEYSKSPGRGRNAGKPEIALRAYLRDFELLDRAGLEKILSRIASPSRIDMETVLKLHRSVSEVSDADKENRGWAHEQVNREGWPEVTDIDPFLLEQRQVIDTLYNAGLADSAGSDIDLLSSAPTTAGSARLEQANEFAGELIRHSKSLRSISGPPENDGRRSQDWRVGDPVSTRNPMHELFESVRQPNRPAPPLRQLFKTYWEMIAEDDMWFPWRDSCDQLEYALLRAERRQQARLPADAHLPERWDEHLTMLQNRLPHLRVSGRDLITPIDLDGQDFETTTRVTQQANLESPSQEFSVEELANSRAAAEYIDRYIRIVSR